MNHILLGDIFFFIVLVLLSIPMGFYIYKVMTREFQFLSKIERLIYRLVGNESKKEMTAKQYIFAVLSFSAIGIVVTFSILMLQHFLPSNPEGFKGVSWDLAFGTASSFVSNTNWQSYAGESTMSYFSQAIALCVQNFVSAATGLAVFFALVRGLVVKQQKTIGNFWVDLTRIILYILLPLSFFVAILLVSQGVVQTFEPYKVISILENGVTQVIPLGPAASQIAIKQLGTNGGGFFGANSAFPLENPTQISNFVETLSILLIPASLCVTFGRAAKDAKQGASIYFVMGLIFIVTLIGATLSEMYLASGFSGVLSSGSMEGKEVIHGIGMSTLWGTSTTAASNGSVNAMLESVTPLAGMGFMFLIQLGGIVFGGVGTGLVGMLAFVILTVFIAGLMVGRTPEYLGKKIEPFDMKMVCVILLAPPILSLFGTATAVMLPSVALWVSSICAHGFTEVLYNFSSMANNNGSSFSGMSSNNAFVNVFGGIIMLVARFVPITAALLLAGSLASKKHTAKTAGTLSTSSGTFVCLLLVVIVLFGALNFLPVLTLGPIADFLTH